MFVWVKLNNPQSGKLAAPLIKEPFKRGYMVFLIEKEKMKE